MRPRPGEELPHHLVCVDPLVPVGLGTHVEARAQRSSLLVFNIVERKGVLTLHIQLNDRSGDAVDTGIVKIIVSLKFPPPPHPTQILLSPCLTGLQSGTPLEVAAIRSLLLQTWHI